jgi:mannose-6-phosphate isomerase-like protein (cupin superfamily)
MEAFELDEVRRDQQERGERYLQFLNQGSLSLGLYVLPAGGTDLQTPHREDEVYYVVSGRATVNVDGETSVVQPGSMIFVAKEVEHRFFDIEEELSLLVFFAPQHAG